MIPAELNAIVMENRKEKHFILRGGKVLFLILFYISKNGNNNLQEASDGD